jgi:hypothetical protein
VIAIPFAVIWAGYSVALWGYALIRGYNAPFGQLVNPVHPASWSTIKASQIPAGTILPGSVPTPAQDAGGQVPTAGGGQVPTTGTGGVYVPPTAV